MLFKSVKGKIITLFLIVSLILSIYSVTAKGMSQESDYINGIYLANVADRYNTMKGSKEYDVRYDLNTDGIIDLYDLVIFFNDSTLNLDKSDISNLNGAEQYWWYMSNSNHEVPVMNPYIPFNINKYKYKYVGDTSKKVIYLTFDTEYKANNIPIILDILEKNNIRANFFVIEYFLNMYPEYVKEISNMGNLVCNHSSTHLVMTSIINDKTQFQNEIKSVEKKYKELTGKRIGSYFRPPEGRYNEQVLKYVEDLGYTTTFWSFSYKDWDDSNQPAAESAKNEIISSFHNGEILLMHAASDTNAKILDDVINEAKSQGYSFELLP